MMRKGMWGSSLSSGEHERVRKKLAEVGIDLDVELGKRGRGEAPKSASVKIDYGDLGEVLGYAVETRVDGVSEDYVWAKNIQQKTMSRVSLPGIDGIAIELEDLDLETELTEDEWIKLCEWKHSEDSDGILTPCQRSAEYLLGVTLPKLLQELKLISKDLKKRGDSKRALRIYMFAHEYARRSAKVRLVCAILGINHSQCCSQLERGFVERLERDGWPGGGLCGTAILVPSVADLARNIYARFVH
jgi:hypothetical protein